MLPKSQTAVHSADFRALPTLQMLNIINKLGFDCSHMGI